MKKNERQVNILLLSVLVVSTEILTGCINENSKKQIIIVPMKEKQISFSNKNHALDNNDNFSPDGKFLCYDTRGTDYNDNMANCK